jgi:hypothetical protein
MFTELRKNSKRNGFPPHYVIYIFSRCKSRCDKMQVGNFTCIFRARPRENINRVVGLLSIKFIPSPRKISLDTLMNIYDVRFLCKNIFSILYLRFHFMILFPVRGLILCFAMRCVYALSLSLSYYTISSTFRKYCLRSQFKINESRGNLRRDC